MRPPHQETRTDDLIASLTSEVRPVRRVWSPTSRMAFWVICQAFVLLWFAALFGPRRDLVQKLREPSFVVPLLLLAGGGLAEAVLALLAAVPDRGPARRTGTALAAASLTLLALALGFAPSRGESIVAWADGWPCAVRTAELALVPLTFLLFAIRRGATLTPSLAGVLAGAASFSMAAVAMRLICASDERWHLIAWHLAPVAIGVVLAGAIGARWLGGWLPQRGGESRAPRHPRTRSPAR